MRLRMWVIQGPDAGRDFIYDEEEPTNILVGREDRVSQAHWRLSKDDRYVSRSHFTLEVRPPNILLIDPASCNGTWLTRPGQGERRVEETLLHHGDRIKIGYTLLGVEIILGEAHQLPDIDATRTVERPGKKPDASLCVRCGKALASPPILLNTNLREEHFMCLDCQDEIARAKAEKTPPKAPPEYCCSEPNCQTDLSNKADQDGRAVELASVVTYLCPRCAESRHQSHQADIGGYQILRLLGRGGMGEVYLGWHPGTCRLVAIKQMLPIAQSKFELLIRFQREMAIMQALRHPNLVRLYEAGQNAERPFFVSEYVPDGDLNQFISGDGEPRLHFAEAINLITQALNGLEYFHHPNNLPDRSFIHRDIKPENILIRREAGVTRAKLSDFGLSKAYGEAGGLSTRTGEFCGTWAFMPPEQITNFKNSQPVVDVYAMGVTLYYILSGHLPLKFPLPWEIKKNPFKIRLGRDPVKIILEDEPKELETFVPGLPPRLYQVVERAIQKDARQRYQSAGEFAEQLNSVIQRLT